MRRRKYPKYRIKKGTFSFNSLNEKQTNSIIIILLFACAGIMFLALADVAGSFGGVLKVGLLRGFGKTAFLIPLLLLSFAIIFLQSGRKANFEVKKAGVVGAAIMILGLASFFQMVFVKGRALESSELIKGGGYLGYGVSVALMSFLGFWGTLIISLALFFCGFVMMFSITFTDLADFLKKLKEIITRMYSEFYRRIFPEEKVKIKGLAEGETGSEINQQSLFKTVKEGDKKEDKSSGTPSMDFKVRSIDLSKKGAMNTEESYQKIHWQPYPLDLLESRSSLPTSGDIKANLKIIPHALHNFGIDVEMGEVNVGPTVTQYTLKPAEGVKLSKITALHNDLSLALAAHPIRIEAPIPGKSFVGIEVPNKTASIVRLRQLIESQEYLKAKSLLSLVLGRDVAGNPIIANLSKMPHLLISGATGSGKSVCINTLILTLLYRNSPKTLRIILVDPKKVEMTSYNQVPHLLTPVITEVGKTINSLRWLIGEMDRRFRLFAESSSRDIVSYNQKFKENTIPYIVLIVDELADLMATAAAEMEACIVRLAQMSRATGIHLVLATQRPSVDVITGLIKANITARIAFAVASMVDSRTILDMSGAEKLLGNGDMLYINSDLGKPKRIQGAFITEGEIGQVTNWFSKSYKDQDFKNEIVEQQNLPASSLPNFKGDANDEEDELLGSAKEVVFQAKKASASLLQRRLKIGYARAARLLDIMESKRIIGPADGAKPRQLLVNVVSAAPVNNNEENSEEGVEEEES